MVVGEVESREQKVAVARAARIREPESGEAAFSVVGAVVVAAIASLVVSTFVARQHRVAAASVAEPVDPGATASAFGTSAVAAEEVAAGVAGFGQGRRFRCCRCCHRSCCCRRNVSKQAPQLATDQGPLV